MRASATPPFEAALQPVPAGVSSLYGAAAPFGTPAFAWRDAADISAPSLQARDVSAPAAIPGFRAAGSLWPSQRFALRVPQAWNGRLVVAGCPGQRTEFACDLLFADWLLARGYAYVTGNKGNGDGAAIVERDAVLRVDGVALPRFPLPDGRGVSFWQHAPGRRMERWPEELHALAQLASDALATTFGRTPDFTYAIGLSNGGYQVRRAIEQSDAFDGALAWNAVMWGVEHNPLDSLSRAVQAMERNDPQGVEEAGFPPNIAAKSGNGSLYARNFFVYWYVTLWLHAAYLDPQTSTAYGDVADPEPAGALARALGTWRSDRTPEIAARIQAIANTGHIRCKLIDLASEYDHLIPPKVHFEPYRALVDAAGASALYRARMMPGTQHVDSWSEDPEYPSLHPGQPTVVAAWDELVAWVEGERAQ